LIEEEEEPYTNGQVVYLEKPCRIQFIVPGRAVPAVRMTQRSLHVNKQAKRYLAYKDEVKWRAELATSQKLKGDIQVEIQVYLRGKRRMDIDNIAKSLLDGCNSICYDDDSQVTYLQIQKHRVANIEEQRVELTLQQAN
jgi:crossover junction endodeoxyribonuclease RusA